MAGNYQLHVACTKPHLLPHYWGVRQEYWQILSYPPSTAQAGLDKMKANK